MFPRQASKFSNIFLLIHKFVKVKYFWMIIYLSHIFFNTHKNILNVIHKKKY